MSSVHIGRHTRPLVTTHDLSRLTLSTLADLKTQLLPALAMQPLQAVLPEIETPTSVDDFRIYEDPAEAGGDADGAEEVLGMRCIEEAGQMGRSVRALGWERWKRLYVRYVWGMDHVTEGRIRGAARTGASRTTCCAMTDIQLQIARWHVQRPDIYRARRRGRGRGAVGRDTM
jgi:hypothetical protein